MDNSQEILRARARRRVSAVVLLIDDFTGRPVKPGIVELSAAEQIEPPICKDDGYYVFSNCNADVLTIQAKSRFYHEKTISVKCSDLPQLRPIVRLRLTPNRNYAIPSRTTCVEGTVLPDSEIRIFCTNDPRPLRLLEDYSREGENCLLYLYDQSGSDPEGRTFALMRRGSWKVEYFTVRERAEAEEGGCLLTKPLQSSYKKAGISVFPVFTARADENGEFFLPLPMMGIKTCQCSIMVSTDGKSWQEHTVELEAGEVTRVCLTGGPHGEDE